MCPTISLTNTESPTLGGRCGGCTRVACPTNYIANTKSSQHVWPRAFEEPTLVPLIWSAMKMHLGRQINEKRERETV